jgi:GT2 family glycosyltransferase
LKAKTGESDTFALLRVLAQSAEPGGTSVAPGPDISIVIVSYNVWEYLQLCIDSILSQKNITAEIILIDNHSTDATCEQIISHYPIVKLISNSTNNGFSAANNQGISQARGEVIILLNPDTVLNETDTLHQIKNWMIANPQAAILAPCLLNTDGSFQGSFWNYSGIKELILELFYLHRVNKIVQPNSPAEVQAASGAALIFRKSLTDEIGGLDENMFWMEDTDFCYRASETGGKIIWNPGIKITHHGGKSTTGNYSLTIPNQVMSRIKFSKKHNSVIYFSLINMLSLVFICSRLIVFSLGSVASKTFNEKRKAYFLTLKSYFRFNFLDDTSIIK